jgi:serine/threonine protein kinase
MSPEVINLMPYTIKSEIWSLGILFYNIFFDEHPYGYLSSISDYKSKLKSQPEFKEIDIFSDQFYNDTFNDLIQKMLSINPNSRPDINYILDEINKCSSNESDELFLMDENQMDNKMELNNTLSSKLINLNISGTKSIYKSAFSTNYLESDKISTYSNSFINSPMNNLNINLMKPSNMTLDGFSLSKTIIIENYF